MENNVTKSIEVQPDILQIIPNDQLINLRDLFKIDWPSHVHIYNFIDTCIRWKKDKKFEDYVTIYSANGDWSDGTIVAILELHCYDIIVYSLDKKLIRARQALKETKKINWKKNMMFPSTRMEFKEPLSITTKELLQPIVQDVPSYIWWLPKEKALQYEWSIPSEYYVADLKTSDADVLNADWPHRHPGSEVYISKLIEINGGIGLFSKQNGELCAWVLKSYLGALGILQTAEKYKRKGLGSLIAKIFSKKLAEDGLDSIGCVVLENYISQNMFQKLGFEKIIAVTWLLNFKI